MAIAKRTVSGSSSKSEFVEKNHFINLFAKDGNVSLGYMTIDEHSELVEACQANPNFAENYFGNEYISARYTQRGVSQEKKLNLPKFN